MRLLVTLFLFSPLLFAQTDEEIAKLSRELDLLYRSDSSQAVMSMRVVTPHYERTLTMTSWTQGKDLSLVRITAPRKEKGISTLKRDTEMWNYIPKIRKLVRIPPSMMMGSWMGSDFTNDDLMRDSSWEDDYTAKRAPDEEGQIVAIFTPKPEAAVTWEKVITYFSIKERLPTKQVFYDEQGRKVRELLFQDIKEFDGRRIPSRMILIPLLKEGNRTEVIYQDLQFDVKIDKNLFTKAGLKRGA